MTGRERIIEPMQAGLPVTGVLGEFAPPIETFRDQQRKAAVPRLRFTAVVNSDALSFEPGFLESIQTIDPTDVGRYNMLVSSLHAPLPHAEIVELYKTIENGIEAQNILAENNPASDANTLRNDLAAGLNARNKVIAHNIRLAISNAKRYLGGSLPWPDLIQESVIGLISAAERYDYRKGYQFSTYATWWIRQALFSATTGKENLIVLPTRFAEFRTKLFAAIDSFKQENGRIPSIDELAKAMGVKKRKIFTALKGFSPVSLNRRVNSDTDGTDGKELLDFVADKNSPSPEDEATKERRAEAINLALQSLTPREAKVIELRFGLVGGIPLSLRETGEKLGLSGERIRQIEEYALDRLRHPLRTRKLKQYLTT